ncbi:hypothetical protein AVEN_273585-1 [Araneus ventricosus]|uniref:Uncharacterized protein n=1 Tax=Araneus ventricosus TaxID=182803 RepID=A0A4Y2M8R5_ARAVE|nr:hypothetical protein AVEN_273585-1 [Araneus ventricosus]
MLQLASSNSSTESEIAKAERMRRRNHLHDEMRWRAVGIVTKVFLWVYGVNSPTRRIMEIEGCGTITKGIKTPVEDVGLDVGESPQRQTIATCCNVPDGRNGNTGLSSEIW